MMEQQPIEDIKPKISRSAARHLRRKKLNAARRDAEKDLLSAQSSSIEKQISSVAHETSKSAVNVKTSNSKSVFQINIKNSEHENTNVEAKEQNASDLLKNKINNVKIKSNQNKDLIFLNSEINKNNLIADTETQTKTIEICDKKDSKLVTIISNLQSANIPENCNLITVKMDSQEKSREQIKAEREAKKAAKAAAKIKGKGKDTVDGSALVHTNKVEKPKIQDKLKDSTNSTTVKTVLIHKQNIITEEKNKSDDKPKSVVDKKPEEKPKSEEKSKAELRAERRAKQEAQRAAKATEKQKPAKTSLEKLQSKPVVPVHKEAPVKKTVTKPEVQEDLHEVNLFKHLYISRRNILKCISRKDVTLHPAILRLGVQYEEKVIVGSNARCVALLATLKQLIEDFERPSQADFTRGLEAKLQESVNHLNACRPLAVSMQNALKHLKWHMNALPSTVPDEEAKSKLANAIDTYIQEQILLADKAISNAIQRKILDEDVILTYGFSSLIYKILCDAHTAGKKFRVVIIDGRPWLEGKELLRRLVKHGIDCSYMLINALSFIMPQVNKVFLGAHAILANGAVMSRVGTAQVALIANAFNVPVLVACETHKSCERVQTDSIVYNEIGIADHLLKNTFTNKKSCLSNWKSKKTLNLLNITYDVTPADLVTAVVTELAILPCTSVPVILRELNHLKFNM